MGTMIDGCRSSRRYRSSRRSGGGGKLFLCCFNSRFFSSSSSSSMNISSRSILSPARHHRDYPLSLSASLSRRLRSDGSLKGGQSPMFPTTTTNAISSSKKRTAGALDNPEPSSPKVTCIGQVRVKSKNKRKKNNNKHVRNLRNPSRRRSGGDGSFRRTDNWGSVDLSSSVQTNIIPENRHRNQRWVHLPLTICEGLKGLGAEISCLLPCRSSSSSSSSCFSSSGEKKRERSIRSNLEAEILEANKLDSSEEKDDDEGKRVCVPPKNALLLMRCRSDPMRMAALSRRLLESPLSNGEENADFEDPEPERFSQANANLITPVIGDTDVDTEADSSIDMPEEEEDEAVEDKSGMDEESEEEPQDEEEEEDSQIGSTMEEEEEDYIKIGSTMEEEEDYIKIGSTMVEEEEEDIKRGSIMEEEEDIKRGSIVVEEEEEDIKRGSTIVVEEEEEDIKRGSIVEEEEDEEDIKRGSTMEEEEEDIKRGSTMEEEEEDIKRGSTMEKEEEDIKRGSTMEEEEEEEEENAGGSLSASGNLDEEDQELIGDENKEEEGDSLSVHSDSESELKCENIAMKEMEIVQEKAAAAATNESSSEEEESEIHVSGLWQEDDPAPPSPELPDCLLLMMGEPKVSMEVSKETWVCTTDFMRFLPERRRPENKSSHEPEKKVDTTITNTQPKAELKQSQQQPRRSSCSIPGKAAPVLTAQKLPRCKSEPMRTAASKLVPSETCLWKSRKVGF